jgi:hypothetical protein
MSAAPGSETQKTYLPAPWAAPAQDPSARGSSGETKVRPFLERHSLVPAGCLVAIAVLRIAAAWPLFDAIGDEPAHFAAAMEYLSKHVCNYDRQHAPLACVMAALGPDLAGARSHYFA